MNGCLEREREVSLAAVAGEVGMSYFHFSRAFKQSMGVSPNNYLVERRIERAKKLLAETDTPVVEVALRVGFRQPEPLHDHLPPAGAEGP